MGEGDNVFVISKVDLKVVEEEVDSMDIVRDLCQGRIKCWLRIYKGEYSQKHKREGESLL